MLRRIPAAMALVAALWAAAIWLSGGLAVSVAGIGVSSSNPLRPLIAALVFCACYAALSGPLQRRLDAAAVKRRFTAVRTTAVLIGVVVAVGIARNSWTAGGSDAYSYVSQADLWLEGKVKIEVPLASQVPWPNGLATFVPFGYAPVPNEQSIAPMTPPGLPLMMAAFKLVAGHSAGFLAAPLSGALLLWATFLLGGRIGSPSLGLGATWLVATSPTFLMMFKSQMSDVPASAFWALATYWAFGNSGHQRPGSRVGGLGGNADSPEPRAARSDSVPLADPIQQ